MQAITAKIYLFQLYVIGAPVALFLVLGPPQLGVVGVWLSLCVHFAVGAAAIMYYAFWTMDMRREVSLIQVGRHYNNSIMIHIFSALKFQVFFPKVCENLNSGKILSNTASLRVSGKGSFLFAIIRRNDLHKRRV